MRQLRFALIWLALAGAVPAFAARDVVPRDVMLVLDNSGSMVGNDPARLAPAAVQEFIKAQPIDTRVGIVLFADAAALIAPLTLVEDESTAALTGALGRFDYRGQWTQLAAGVERALYELRQHGRAGAARAIVLITDGLVDTGAAARDAELKAWLQTGLAEQAQGEHVRIFGIAFTERADYQLLQSLASATGAEYFRVLDAADLAPALQRIETTLSAPVAQPAPKPAAAEPAPAPAAVVPAEPPRAPGVPLWPWLLGSLALVAVAVAFLRRSARGAPQSGAAAAGPSGPPGPLAVLVDLNHPSGPRRYEIAHRPVVIGRKAGSDPAQDYVVVPDRTVGRWHATIFRQGQSFTIRDENSMNGTFVNNERIRGVHPLRHSDIVRVHGHTFEFLIPELADSESTVLIPGRAES